MTEIDPHQWVIDHFRYAQNPRSWLMTAVGLLDSAAQIYHSAAGQAERYETASHEATERAYRELDESGDDSALSEIDEAEPLFLPAFMLYGFAIENLLKGIIVMNDPSKVKDDKIGVPKTHDLRTLAGDAKVKITTDEAKMLTALSTITTWSGRYPVALNLQEFAPVGLDREAIIRRHNDAHGTTIALANKLRRVLEGEKPLRRSGVMVVHRP